jgi:hypothetical protein
MDRLQFAVDRLRFVRLYVLPLLKGIAPEDWFKQPSEGVTHLAWQVGHITVAQYGLALARIRGKRPEDRELIPEHYFAIFGRGSTVEADPSRYPSPEEIREVMDRVHRHVVEEVRGYRDEDLDQPPIEPHPAFPTKFGALVFCSEHEMSHAGQIGLLRRLIGYPSIR